MALGTDKMTAEQKAIAIGVLNYLIQEHSSEIVWMSDRLRSVAGNIPAQTASVSPTSFEEREKDKDGDHFDSMPGLSSSERAAMLSWIEQIGRHRLAISALVQKKLSLFGDEAAQGAGGAFIERDILEMAKAVPAASLQPRDVT